MNKYLEEIISEMHRRVGEEFSLEELNKDLYEWSEEEQDNFREWLVDYMYDNEKARNSLMNSTNSKERCREFADDFIFQYGWKISINEVDKMVNTWGVGSS